MSKLLKLNNGLSIPSIGLGVYMTPSKETEQVVYTGLKLGYKHVDSAHIYKNEQEVTKAMGQYIKDTGSKREDFYYTTKIWNADHGYELTKKSIKERVEFAGPLGYIDLVLMHSPMSDYEKRHGSWMALQEAVDEGVIKSIGVSNYGIKHLKELLAYPDLKYKPVINQIELHPWLCRPELVKFCEDNDIKVEAYSPLVRSTRWGEPILVELSKKYGVSEAQILVRWSLQKGFITLPKSVTESRMKSNLDVDFEIDQDDIDKLSAKDEYAVTPGTWDPTVYPLDNEKKDE